MGRRAPACWLALVLCFGAAHTLHAAVDGDANPPFVTTPPRVIERMLALAKLGADDTLLDLGSGDGRIVIEAAKRFGARAEGIEMSAALVAASRAAAARAGVSERTRFEVGDVLQADLSAASVLTLYLSPGLNERLLPRILAAMRPGSRVVSHDFPLSSWMPDRIERLDVPEKNHGRGGESSIMLWIVPADVAGVWHANVGTGKNLRQFEFSLAQQFQQLEGAVHSRIGAQRIEATLTGTRLELAFPPLASGLSGSARATVEGDTMEGSWTAPGAHFGVPFAARRIRARPEL